MARPHGDAGSLKNANTLDLSVLFNILLSMPLDKVGKEYAAMLYQKRQEQILADQSKETQRITADFGARNMMQSGGYISARATVIGKHAGFMVDAMAQILWQAYEKAGQPLNQATLDEIRAEVNQFSEAQKRNFQAVAKNLANQIMAAPVDLAEAITRTMEGELSRATASALRDLAIKHHEILLDDARAASKGYAAAIGKRWDVFISHASEDKESFVRPLAKALEETGVQVWFDETALTVGDSLRRKIDEGLAHSRFGIVVLSPSFFVKQWPQQELDGLMSREVSGIKVILPIWHNIDFEGVSACSPILAGRYAAKSSDGIAKVVRDLRAAMGL